jgi:hypothetical protein
MTGKWRNKMMVKVGGGRFIIARLSKRDLEESLQTGTEGGAAGVAGRQFVIG